MLSVSFILNQPKHMFSKTYVFSPFLFWFYVCFFKLRGQGACVLANRRIGLSLHLTTDRSNLCFQQMLLQI